MQSLTRRSTEVYQEMSLQAKSLAVYSLGAWAARFEKRVEEPLLFPVGLKRLGLMADLGFFETPGLESGTI